ncbi:MAG: dephospho-CoA kinase [Burkholderiales bacterium]
MAAKPPLVVGLTGGIGSGKSAAAEGFAQHGIIVIEADAISRQLTATNGAAMAAIRQQFGDEFINPDGALNRERMRQKIFSDPLAKNKLEAILHPLIRAESIKRIKAATSPYVILEVPLLFETGGYEGLVNTTLVIDCDEEVQIRRTQSRSGMGEGQVRAIMAAQLPRAIRLKKADNIIDNNGSLQELAKQVNQLHKKYLVQAGV